MRLGLLKQFRPEDLWYNMMKLAFHSFLAATSVCFFLSMDGQGATSLLIAPAPVLRAYNGDYVLFSKLYYPGEAKRNSPRSTVVINFMGLNCPPCEVELPQFLEVARAAADGQGDLKYFLISTDPLSASAELKTYLDGKSVNADKELLLDPYKVAAGKFGVNGIPRTFVISPEGVIVADIVGAVPDYKDLLVEGIKKARGMSDASE
jgi:thiol-disulfide isomerase/thioredoxin